MAQYETKGLTNWWHNLKDKASHALADQEAAFARGKVAGVAVTDDEGRILVEAGQRIDESAIERARQSGKIGALARAAVAAQTQDLKESVQTHYARTESGQEARLLDSVDEYREARTYLGRMLSQDVTDIRGNIVVPAGKTLDDDDIRLARDAGLLAALLVVAEQSPPAAPRHTPTSSAPAEPSVPMPPAVVPPRQAPLLLGDPEE